jgi:DivIVA domain-containing protein
MAENQSAETLSASTFRTARFPQGLLGYDRGAVDAFLARVADWVEERDGAMLSEPQSRLTSEFAAVGERTSGILTAAEEAAAKLRDDAKEYAARLRAEAEEEARRVKLNAGQRGDEIVAEAQAKADRIIEEAVARRRRLNQAVTSLIDRREEIAGEAQRLAEELLGAVEALRTERPPEDDAAVPEPEDETAAPEPDEGAVEEAVEAAGQPFPADEAPIGDEPTELEPPDQRQTAVHEVR